MTKNLHLNDIQHQLDVNADGLYHKHTQHIPDSLLTDLAEQRQQTATQREGDYMKVASIPTVIVEKWMREGFNILDPNIDGREIVKRLKQENLEHFLATEKSI